MAAPGYHCLSDEIFIDEACCLTVFFTVSHNFDASGNYLNLGHSLQSFSHKCFSSIFFPAAVRSSAHACGFCRVMDSTSNMNGH